MTDSSRFFLGALSVFAVSLAPLGALAQASPSAEAGYVPPKVLKLANASSPAVGSGTVVVEVLVRADGTFAVQRIVSSTNHDDDKAALDIARRSTYKPATKGGIPIVSIYEVTLNFAGNGLNRYEQMMIGSGAYARAKSELEAYLAKHPSDQRAQLDLGIAESFMNDSADAVAAFDKAGPVPDKFKPIAAKAYADRATTLTDAKDYAGALVPAKKAATLSPGYESYNTLALAELGLGDGKSASADLEKSLALAESQKAPADRRAVVTANLAAAYAKVGDLEKAKTYAARARQLDPSANGGYAALEHALADQANAAMSLRKYADAAAFFEQAAAIAPADVAMLYTNAAFAYLQEKPANNDKAKADADKALAVDAKNAGANFAEGIALANQGKRQDALAHLTQAANAAKTGNDPTLTANIEKTIQQLNARKK